MWAHEIIVGEVESHSHSSSPFNRALGDGWGSMALWVMGGVGVVGATWARLLPPTRPRGVWGESRGHPLNPGRGEHPSALSLLVVEVGARGAE